MSSRTITASFIVTVGVLAGCSSTRTSNPPPPDPEPQLHVNPPGHEPTAEPTGEATSEAHGNPPAPTPHKNPPAPEASSDHGHGHINPPAPKPTAAEALPEAPDGWQITTRADGSCWARAVTTCPEGARCNPPRPRQVRCKP